MLEFLWEIYGVAEIRWDTTWNTGIFLCLQSLSLIIVEIRTVKMHTLLHSLHLPLILIEIIDIPTACWCLFWYLHRWDDVIMTCSAIFIILFIADVVGMQVKTILETSLWRKTKGAFLWIFSIVLLSGEEGSVTVGILPSEGMILDYGRCEGYQILLAPHQIALVFILTSLSLPGGVDKPHIFTQALRWRLVALSMIDLLPRFVNLNKVLSHSILMQCILMCIGVGVLLIF